MRLCFFSSKIYNLIREKSVSICLSEVNICLDPKKSKVKRQHSVKWLQKLTCLNTTFPFNFLEYDTKSLSLNYNETFLLLSFHFIQILNNFWINSRLRTSKIHSLPKRKQNIVNVNGSGRRLKLLIPRLPFHINVLYFILNVRILKVIVIINSIQNYCFSFFAFSLQAALAGEYLYFVFILNGLWYCCKYLTRR